MGERELDLLRMDPSQARRAADFFESYAATVSRGDFGPAPGQGRHAGTAVSEVADWAARVDTATSLRLAGQWAMLFDTARARRLLSAAGEILHDLGHGFGTYLRVAYSAEVPGVSEVASRVGTLADRQEPHSPDERDDLPPEPLSHPQQQAYLLVAATGVVRDFGADQFATNAVMAGDPGVHGDTRRLRVQRQLRLLISESPHRRGVLPVGALGTPIRAYWDIAASLLRPGPNATDSVVGHLRAMAQRYGTSVDLAMANERLWFNGAAPVDVCDVDITTLSLIAARVLGVDRFRSALQSALHDAHGLQSVPLGIADDMLPETDWG
ncbi:hypothetical protein OG407_24765 [Streptomyces sp. NBC_01515]|uniref:hypothetical protein n=1 Tax=Streptomyces sp. NBC_01515 TaxID=2903890 RepID=UPI00386E0E00